MRKVIVSGLTLMLASVASPALAQEAEALRRELEQMRQGFETMRQQYQKSIDDLAERLRRLEAQPAPVAPPVAVQATPPPSGPPATAPSATDLIRPRQPFALYGQRGSGQLLFDIGVEGDFVGNLTQR